MKKTLLQLAGATLFGAALIAVPSFSRADDSTAKTEASGATKFYGSVTAVDTNAMTFTVNDETFTVTSDSKMTNSDTNATLADAGIGEPARGSYVKGSDGKLDITKVRFGKKTGGKSGGKKKKSADTTDTSTNAPAAAPQN
jgi:hypothetical protein